MLNFLKQSYMYSSCLYMYKHTCILSFTFIEVICSFKINKDTEIIEWLVIFHFFSPSLNLDSKVVSEIFANNSFVYAICILYFLSLKKCFCLYKLHGSCVLLWFITIEITLSYFYEGLENLKVTSLDTFYFSTDNFI